MLETTPFLFEDFVNKDKIMQRKTHLPITRNTVINWVLKIAQSIINQQLTDFKLCNLCSYIYALTRTQTLLVDLDYLYLLNMLLVMKLKKGIG